ncbi:uncharacterized protein BDZ99DRAFT_514589 [Mytilinidion resinicola]|uniref:NACHT domain-containing protein n=1 Tax=Mytilinidion resinicola TaxID=574789 RepID=A0A6A6Z4G8_9PEZI|nr:uncharacterized protein BDZ99DRAFT_514589 [Mytilinidion resinicola]KAF2815966.1 hypothetical protein BDZ99DRAFT_514589 [Mytilinidion resinicola]
MDPFTSLSLATSIIQIVDFSLKLVSKGHDIYKNGSITSFDQAKSIANDLTGLTQSLTGPLDSISNSKAHLSDDELKLSNLATETGQIAQELITLVEHLTRHGGKANPWKSFRQALDTVWSKTKIAEIIDTLNAFRNELILRVVVSLKFDHKFQLAREDERFRSMQQGNKKIAEALLDNKNFFTGGLDRILQYNKDECAIAKIRHEETIAALATLQGHFANLNITDDLKPESLRDLSTLQRDVLNCLWFRFMGDRGAEISNAYKETFQWIYDGEAMSRRAWDSLPEWLQHGEGCFWISGKAGSGKSTLMKFVASDLRTHRLLEQWSEHESLLCASFFFWNSGISLQKSQHGLLRAILHESLSQYPELVPVVFPTHCRMFARRRLDIHDPSLVELMDAFKILTTQTSMPLKICLFIDGVDEYDGDHVKFAEYLRSIASPRCKFLLSSRPTPNCVEAFESCPSLRLQDLTNTDIQTYVRGNLVDNSRVRELLQDNPSLGDLLTSEIVSKASGVFLWVVLVVKALKDGLRNRDNVQDLLRRVDELPADLDNLYGEMLHRMDPFYKRQASMLLQMVYWSTQLPASTPMTALRLSFAMDNNPDTSINANISEIHIDELVRRCRDIEAIVRSRCCGLLEIHGPHRVLFGESKDETVETSTTLSITMTKQILELVQILSNRSEMSADAEKLLMDLLAEMLPLTYIRSQVHFLHKSVVDFLEKPDVWKELQDITSCDGFDGAVSLVSASLCEIKSASVELEIGCSVDDSSIWEILVRALHECSLTEGSTGQAQAMLIEELDATMESHWRKIKGWIPRFGKSLDELGHWSHTVPSSDSKFVWNHGAVPYGSIFDLACTFGLVQYVKDAVAYPGTLSPDSSSSAHHSNGDARMIGLAQRALNRIILDIDNSQASTRLWSLQLEILEFSLHSGASPNLAFFKGLSPFQVALHRCNPRDVSGCQDWKSILLKLVDYGADVNAPHSGDAYLFATGDDWFNSGRDIRVWQTPLVAIQEKFSEVGKAAKTSRTQARKINQLFQQLQSVLMKRGGSHRTWVEREMLDENGKRQIGKWEAITDPIEVESILECL